MISLRQVMMWSLNYPQLPIEASVISTLVSSISEVDTNEYSRSPPIRFSFSDAGPQTMSEAFLMIQQNSTPVKKGLSDAVVTLDELLGELTRFQAARKKGIDIPGDVTWLCFTVVFILAHLVCDPPLLCSPVVKRLLVSSSSAA